MSPVTKTISTAIKKRWLDLIFLSLTAYTLIYFLWQFNFVKEFFHYWVMFFSNLENWLQGSLSLLLGVTTYLFLENIGVSNNKRAVKLTHYLRYPPITLSAYFLFALLISVNAKSLHINFLNTIPLIIFIQGYIATFLFLKHYSSNQKFECGLLYALCLTPLFLVFTIPLKITVFLTAFWILPFFCLVLLNEKTYLKNSLNTDNKSAPGDINNWSETQIIKWVNSNNPVDNTASLLFNHQIYVERIFKLLKTQSTRDSAQTLNIALCGEFGAGKSSIIKSVQEKLENQDTHDWLFCDINAWGREDTSIDKQLLEAILKTISESVDTLKFKSLPRRYHDALNSTRGLSAALSKLLVMQDTDFENDLININEILAAKKQKLLVVIEDIDRSSKKQELCEDVAALIDRMKPLSNINFIIAIGYEYGLTELIRRVCDYREDIVIANLKPILTRIYEIFVNRVKTSAQPGTNNPFLPLNLINWIDNRYLNSKTKNQEQFDEIDLLCNCLRTPRAFKTAMRNINNLWQLPKIKSANERTGLLGEVELYDLMAIQILKEQEPKVLDFIKLHSHDLLKSNDKKKQQETVEVFANDKLSLNANIKASTEQEKSILVTTSEQRQQDFENTFKNSPINMTAYKALIAKLFPMWLGTNNHNPSKQSISEKRYINRVLLGAVPIEEITDTEILQEMNSFKDSTGNIGEELKPIDFVYNVLNNDVYLYLFNSFSASVFLNTSDNVNKTKYTSDSYIQFIQLAIKILESKFNQLAEAVGKDKALQRMTNTLFRTENSVEFEHFCNITNELCKEITKAKKEDSEAFSDIEAVFEEFERNNTLLYQAWRNEISEPWKRYLRAKVNISNTIPVKIDGSGKPKVNLR